MQGEPNQTLYIKNINEKLSKNHRVAELKSTLRNLCKPAEVIDIVALGNFYDKGQAFVVLKNVEQATAAMKKLQGYELEGQELRVAYARSKSHAVAKLDGTYAGHKRKQRPKPGKKGKPSNRMDEDDNDDDDEDEAPPKHAPPPPAFAAQPAGNFSQPPPGFGAYPMPGPAPAAAAAPALPHPVLFVENLPHDADAEAVSALFRQFLGFKETRMVPSRPGIAFVEFENEMQSGLAMQRLQGVQMQGLPVAISFSKSS